MLRELLVLKHGCAGNIVVWRDLRNLCFLGPVMYLGGASRGFFILLYNDIFSIRDLVASFGRFGNRCSQALVMYLGGASRGFFNLLS